MLKNTDFDYCNNDNCNDDHDRCDYLDCKRYLAINFAMHLNLSYLQISSSSRPEGGRGSMAKPPDSYKHTKEEKTRVKQKRGSKKYLHLLKFIETRRRKKMEKRCTLDPSAEVTLFIEDFW